jgi:PRTRC genetic system protein B
LDTYINLKSTASFELREALLVYSCDQSAHAGSGKSTSFVTKHSVKQSPTGAPSLGPGSPLGESDIVTLIEQLRGALPSEFLPENVLMRTQETIVWWTPATTRPMFYATDKGAELEKLSGKRFPQPALVLRARGGSLDIRALAENMRPTPDTPMYVAPYWNVSDNGSVCLGSTKSPREASVKSLPRWESSFFESEFTHANAHTGLTNHPGGFMGLWLSLIGKKKFPVEHLRDAKETLAKFLKV